MKLNKNAEPIYTDNLWYDLLNGYITPSLLLEDEDEIEKVKQAIELLNQFTNEACEAGLIIID